jgi:hypothetical protein
VAGGSILEPHPDLTTHANRAQDDSANSGTLRESIPPSKRNSILLRGDARDWPAAAKLAIKIRTEIEERASAHLELWERLDHLILAAPDKRSEDQDQHTRRRLRLLCTGSVIGLGSMLVVWGVSPRFGIADPTGIQWLGYLSAVLMLFFPLSLAYIVIVQRAMDIRILVRLGTKYALARTTLAIFQLVVAALISYYFIYPIVYGARHGAASLIISVVAIAMLHCNASWSVSGPSTFDETFPKLVGSKVFFAKRTTQKWS